MFFTNKWANLFLLLALMVLVSIIVVKSAKVVAADGTDTGNKLALGSKKK